MGVAKVYPSNNGQARHKHAGNTEGGTDVDLHRIEIPMNSYRNLRRLLPAHCSRLDAVFKCEWGIVEAVEKSVKKAVVLHGLL